MTENNIILQALKEWEENHYEILNEEEQKTVNKLIEHYLIKTTNEEA